MSKQSDILDGLMAWMGAYGIEEEVMVEAGGELFRYLHSQGVEVRVKCPDCAWSQFGEEAVGLTPCYCYSCNSTGYIVEPLIDKG